MSAKKIFSILLAVVFAVSTFTACGSTAAPDIIIEPDSEKVPLAVAPAIPTMLLPVASGVDVRKNSKAQIDVSNMKDGYVMIRYLGSANANLRVLITGPSNVQYTYFLRADGQYEVFPLSDGNGRYTIGVFRNIRGNQFATDFSTSINVTLTDAFAPFLRPNQFVNFNENTLAVKKAAELVAGVDGTIEKVGKIYNYVISNFTYDRQLAESVQSGYVPDLDKVWQARKGICFDYASLTAAMLRSQGIPTKLVVGYAGKVYHAWISVWTEEEGWIDGIIYFDGKEWKLMDPTFAASARSSANVMAFIGDGKNYAVRFLY